MAMDNAIMKIVISGIVFMNAINLTDCSKLKNLFFY